MLVFKDKQLGEGCLWGHGKPRAGPAAMNDQELGHAVAYERENQKHVNLLQQDMRLLRTALQKFEYTARVKLAGLDEKLNR